MSNREFRFTSTKDLRVVNTDGKRTITGYCSVYNSMSENLGGFREQILPGAFRQCLNANPDVRALINHDENLILGRTASGTLRLSDDPKGLRIECDLPDTSYARDLIASMERMDISQMSFGFYCDADDWSLSDDGTPIRSVRQATVFDVSPCTYPAYVHTSASLRSLFPDAAVIIPELRMDSQDEGDDECLCACSECLEDDCDSCSDPSCCDPNCSCADMRSITASARLRLAQASL